MPRAKEHQIIEIEQVFTDRIEEQRLFNDLYNSLKKENYEVIDFWGIPGIGKSSLNSKLQLEIKRRSGKNHYVCIDFHKNRKEEADYIEELARKLQNESRFSFPILSVALSIYLYKLYGENKRLEDLKDSFENNHPLLTKLIKPTIASMGLIPAISSASTLVEKLIETFEGDLKEWILEHKRELLKIDNYSVQHLAKQLPYFFVIDYNKNMEKEIAPTVIFLDTYEAHISEIACIGYEYENDSWLRNSEKGIVSQCKNTIWVIAGRERIVWDDLDDYWKGKIHFCELQDFSKDYARQYLNSVGVKDMTIVSRIIDSSKGVPFHLYLSVEYYFQQTSKGISSDLIDFGNDYEEIFRKYVEGMRDADKTVIFLMACFGKWKRELFTSSSLREHVSDILSLDKIHRLSFIRFDGKDTYYLHSEAEEILRKRCPKQVKEIFVNHIAKKSESFKMTEDDTVEFNINRIRDELEPDYIVRELYHSEEKAISRRNPQILIRSYENNKVLLMKYLAEKEYSKFDALLAIYMQAYNCTINLVDEEKIIFVEILRLALKKFIDKEWYSNAIATEEELLKLLSSIPDINHEEILYERYRKLSLNIMLPHSNALIEEMENLYDECKKNLGMKNSTTTGIRALYEYMQMVNELRYEIDSVERFAEEEKRLYGISSPRGVKADINVAYAYKLHEKYEDSIRIGNELLGRMECWLDEYDIDYMHAIDNLAVAYYRFGTKKRNQQKFDDARSLFQEGLILSKRVYAVYKCKENDGKRTEADEKDFLGYVARIIEGMALMQDYTDGLELCEEAMLDSYFAKTDKTIKHLIYDAMACVKMTSGEWRKAAYYVKKLYEMSCIEDGPKKPKAISLHKRYRQLLDYAKMDSK